MTVLGLDSVTLDIQLGGRRQNVLRNTSFAFPTKKMALVAEKRSDVVAILDLLSRKLIPQSGLVRYAGRVSWPIGQPGPFSVAITGTQAVSHLATLYDFDRNLALDFLRAEFDAIDQLSKPILTWPRLQQTQFMMLMALVPEFDAYLVDGNLVLPEDVGFTQRFLKLFLTRTYQRTVLITVRQIRVLKLLCDGAILVRNGILEYTDDLDAALAISNRIPATEALELEQERPDDDDFLF